MMRAALRVLRRAPVPRGAREDPASATAARLATTARGRRGAIGALARGMALGWVPLALTLLAHVPGRRVYAANEALHGRPAFQFLCAGLLGDLVYVGPLVVVALVAPLAAGAALARRRRPTAARAARALALALPALVLLAAWTFSVAAIESKLERGLYPTYLETRTALGSSSFVVGQLPTLLLDRYVQASVAAGAVGGVLLVAHGRWARRWLSGWGALTGFALSALLLLGAAVEAVLHGSTLFPRTGSYVETRSPLEIVALGRFPFPNHMAPVTDGMRAVLASRSFPLEDVREGLRALGFPASSADRLRAFEGEEPCSAAHPLARPLDRPEGDASSAAPLLADLEALSAALFEGRSEPVLVWQIAMESFRADDVHALQAGAPPALTPVMSRLHADAEGAIAFRAAFQGGFRTAQSLSSLACGVGSLPFNIAMARDLGHLPLRCLPDVLADAGFETRALYASDLAYDGMLDFFRYHGVRAAQAADLPPGLPVGSWQGVSDRALYDQALARARGATRSRYELVLTLSGHSPFVAPTDMPAEVALRAARACAESRAAQPDDCRRLAVMAYADHALGEFLDALERSPLARRSLVVLSGDHATSELFLWGGSTEERGRAQVPYVIVVPRALRAAAVSPAHVGALVARLGERAAAQPVSLTDSPALLLALLSATPELRSVPAPWRFHTLGGQATSPHFALAASPRARVWGTDSAAFVFSADADARVVAYETKNRAFSRASELDELNPSLRGPAAVLASFVKGYLTRCERGAQLRSASPP